MLVLVFFIHTFTERQSAEGGPADFGELGGREDFVVDLNYGSKYASRYFASALTPSDSVPQSTKSGSPQDPRTEGKESKCVEFPE